MDAATLLTTAAGLPVMQAPGLQTSFPLYLYVAMDAAALMQVGQALQNCLGNGGHHCWVEALQGDGHTWRRDRQREQLSGR